MSNLRDYAAAVPMPGASGIGDTHVLGLFLCNVTKLNCEQRNFPNQRHSRDRRIRDMALNADQPRAPASKPGSKPDTKIDLKPTSVLAIEPGKSCPH